MTQLPQTDWFTARSNQTKAGDLILLTTPDHKRFLIRIQPGRKQHTHLGIFDHDALIGQTLGSNVYSQIGHAALLIEPSLSDLMRQIRRGTQIIYPKDAAYIVHRLSLRAGSRVIEAGTGSGGLTIALAWAIAPTGTVYSYEARPDTFALGRNNLERVGLLPHVELFNESIENGFRQKEANALFLDVRTPWRFLEQAREALCLGGFFASLVPTTNQVSKLIAELEQQSFVDINVEELLLRRYKPVADRLRPDDNMIGHTGFLIFARTVSEEVDSKRWFARERKRYQAKQAAAAKIEAEEAKRAVEQESGGRKYPKIPLP